MTVAGKYYGGTCVEILEKRYIVNDALEIEAFIRRHPRLFTFLKETAEATDAFFNYPLRELRLVPFCDDPLMEDKSLLIECIKEIEPDKAQDVVDLFDCAWWSHKQYEGGDEMLLVNFKITNPLDPESLDDPWD